MPRHPRLDYTNAVHHISARGNNRAALFQDDKDRLMYLRLLGLTVRFTEWRCLAYCLMTNHIHLLLETPTPNLSVGMHRLQGTYAKFFNYRHDRTGHVFEKRFHSELVLTDAHLLTVCEYIANNPVKAGICPDPAAWPWSSFRAPELGAQPAWLDEKRLEELTGGGESRRGTLNQPSTVPGTLEGR